MHTPSNEGPGMHTGMHIPRYEGTPPVVDAPPPVHMCPGMHTPRYEGTPPVVDGLISTYTFGVVESIWYLAN